MVSKTAKRERSCIGCGAKASKSSLHRIVRCPDGSVGFDALGNATGRGAYVCSKPCFDKALANGRLAKALRAPIDRESADRMGLQIEAACAAGEY